MLAAQPAKADIFLFSDITDVVTITSSGTRLFDFCPGGPTCSPSFLAGEYAFGYISGPAVDPGLPPEQVVDSSFTLGVTIWIADSSGAFVSDRLATNNFGDVVGLDFLSDADNSGTSPTLCADVGGCQLIEDGTIQTIGTVTWTDGTVDTIQIQSDVNKVPEPSTILLLLTGIACIQTRLWNRNSRS
jgi:hypothetical protein